MWAMFSFVLTSLISTIGASVRFLAMVQSKCSALERMYPRIRKPWVSCFMFWKKRRKIYDQIDEYCTWKQLHSNTAYGNDKEYLLMFATMFPVEAIQDIRVEQALEFGMKMTTTYQSGAAVKALRCFLRYYRARGYICMHPAVVKY